MAMAAYPKTVGTFPMAIAAFSMAMTSFPMAVMAFRMTYKLKLTFILFPFHNCLCLE